MFNVITTLIIISFLGSIIFWLRKLHNLIRESIEIKTIPDYAHYPRYKVEELFALDKRTFESNLRMEKSEVKMLELMEKEAKERTITYHKDFSNKVQNAAQEYFSAMNTYNHNLKDLRSKIEVNAKVSSGKMSIQDALDIKFQEELDEIHSTTNIDEFKKWQKMKYLKEDF